ncbi:hypothetical protein Goshw_027649 [Gossypium schwendimanii]|uniref:DUF4283 domain-containing protein n=1 Tax=Gossypium schwendimanii TaxID=34291 RepID=A0A7J9LCL3_GOSSC|nr:hypothetical protein [Gossypium schwendimanii]
MSWIRLPGLPGYMYEQKILLCGRYGYVNEACLNRVFKPSVETETLPSGSSPMDLVMANEGTRGRCELYGP